MNQHQRNIIDLILNNDEFRQHVKEESERTKKRLNERMKEQNIIEYTRVDNEEQLERLDRMYANGVLDDEEYIRIRARIRGDRNA